MSEFIEYLGEVFERFGTIQARRMFGGHGLYYDGLMFALVVDGVLYLKAEPKLAGTFRAQGLRPFEYQKNGKAVNLSYYTAPEEILDDPDQARDWANRAYEAAPRARAAKSKPAHRP
jgi:DNA transformation protein